jgi:ABC-type amino acid transport substrate-binding protein
VTTSLFRAYRRRLKNRRTRSSRQLINIIAELVVLYLGICVSPICQAAESPTPSPSQVLQPAEPRLLCGGWYPWDPYQYRENARGNETLTGFDVEIERAVARVMGVELLLPEISWGSHLAGLAGGTRDIAAGAAGCGLRVTGGRSANP